jgi:hypothetical protein
MTTITTESIPTTGSSDRSVGSTGKTWRYVATFAAGVALSIAVAAGMTAATDDTRPTPAPAGSVDSHISNDECPGFVGKPC